MYGIWLRRTHRQQAVRFRATLFKLKVNKDRLNAEKEAELKVDEAVMPGTIEAGVIKDLPVDLGEESC